METFVQPQEGKEAREPLFVFEEGEEDISKTLSNETEYLGKRLSTDQRVPGRVGRPEFVSFWEHELKASPFVLQTIKNGYSFPFRQLPPSSMVKNNRKCCFLDFVKASHGTLV